MQWLCVHDALSQVHSWSEWRKREGWSEEAKFERIKTAAVFSIDEIMTARALAEAYTKYVNCYRI